MIRVVSHVNDNCSRSSSWSPVCLLPRWFHDAMPDQANLEGSEKSNLRQFIVKSAHMTLILSLKN